MINFMKQEEYDNLRDCEIDVIELYIDEFKIKTNLIEITKENKTTLYAPLDFIPYTFNSVKQLFSKRDVRLDIKRIDIINSNYMHLYDIRDKYHLYKYDVKNGYNKNLISFLASQYVESQRFVKEVYTLNDMINNLICILNQNTTLSISNYTKLMYIINQSLDLNSSHFKLFDSKYISRIKRSKNYYIIFMSKVLFNVEEFEWYCGFSEKEFVECFESEVCKIDRMFDDDYYNTCVFMIKRNKPTKIKKKEEVK